MSHLASWIVLEVQSRECMSHLASWIVLEVQSSVQWYITLRYINKDTGHYCHMSKTNLLSDNRTSRRGITIKQRYITKLGFCTPSRGNGTLGFASSAIFPLGCTKRHGPRHSARNNCIVYTHAYILQLGFSYASFMTGQGRVRLYKLLYDGTLNIKCFLQMVKFLGFYLENYIVIKRVDIVPIWCVHTVIMQLGLTVIIRMLCL